MKPEEKAKELVDRFKGNKTKKWSDPFITAKYTDNSKQCALICVEEIIKLLPCINETPPIHRKSEENYIQFWKYGVKSEIQKL